jgi:hypothetical protein
MTPGSVWSESGTQPLLRPSQNDVEIPKRPIRALQHVRRMRGGSEPHLLRCSDRHYYVAKAPNNPQGRRILANELLGSRLAASLGLPVATGLIIAVPEDLIRLSPGMVIELCRGRKPTEPGLWFGSRYPVNPRRGTVSDLLPLDQIGNRGDLLGTLVFDKWTCNTDGRQLIFFRAKKDEQFTALMIDQGFCFNGESWDFPDSPRRGGHRSRGAYDTVTGIDAFEPWLSRLESAVNENAIFRAAEGIPQEWYAGEEDALLRLLERLNRRRSIIRELIYASRGELFPNWQKASALSASA